MFQIRVLVMSILGSIPNHTPLKHGCLNKTSNWVRCVYFIEHFYDNQYNMVGFEQRLVDVAYSSWIWVVDSMFNGQCDRVHHTIMQFKMCIQMSIAHFIFLQKCFICSTSNAWYIYALYQWQDYHPHPSAQMAPYKLWIYFTLNICIKGNTTKSFNL